ncbi:MAG: hypothetical protein K0R17_1032 [Rariglobus sp.]|jgi:hypothetical protein|nr:hypothetical protein [Rariglobus sp.]
MPKKNHLAAALAAFLPLQKTTGGDYARTIGLSAATISRLLSGDRPAVDTLHTMSTKWPDSRASLGLLVAHLRDEIDRAGRNQAEIEVTASTIDETDDIHLLAREARHDPELAAILHDFAKMIRAHKKRYPEANESDLRAAE